MNTVVVFTAKSAETIFRQGGCGYWSLNAERARKCRFVLVTANAHHRQSEHATHDHGRGFLIGKISGLRSVDQIDFGQSARARWLIEFSEYAVIDLPNAWGGFQNPVRYMNLDEFEIDPKSLDWKGFPQAQIEQADDSVTALTIEEAKRGLGKQLGVSPESIEIIVRA